MSRKPYVRQIPKTSWFMAHARYKSYVLHELSCIFVALYSVVLIAGLFSLALGKESWDTWYAWVTSPVGVVFHLLAFVFFIIHTMSWFKAVPQATRIQRGEDFVPGSVLVGAHYAVLAAVSLFVLILAGVA